MVVLEVQVSLLVVLLLLQVLQVLASFLARQVVICLDCLIQVEHMLHDLDEVC